MPKFTSTTAAAYGKRGGTTTYQRHGRDHMRAIGKRGFQAYVDRHFKGDRRAALNDLIARGLAALDAHMPEPMRKWRYDPHYVPDRLHD